MTACAGFQCSDGVVLCADRQLSDSLGAKYDRGKVWWSNSELTGLKFVFTYSGTPSAAKEMFHKIREDFCSEFAREIDFVLETKIRRTLSRIYKQKTSKEVHTLVGISIGDSEPLLFCTKESKVTPTGTEVLGVGESTVVEFAKEVLGGGDGTAQARKLLGCYLVSLANRYIRGCRGGPDVAILHSNGTISHDAGAFYQKHRKDFSEFEKELETAFWKIKP